MMISVVQPPAGYNALALSGWWRRFASVRLVRFAPARSRASLATAGIGSNSSRCVAWSIPFWSIRRPSMRHGNDRLLLGLKGSLNEYELDLLRQRSLSARYEKARRGELVVAAP